VAGVRDGCGLVVQDSRADHCLGEGLGGSWRSRGRCCCDPPRREKKGDAGIMMGEGLGWQESAVCAQLGMRVADAVFFPEVGGSYVKAKRICGRCPVRVECLAWRLAHEREHPDEVYGMFGGLTAHEREELVWAGRREAAA
jgi:WhiB family transcriptional regulator, redox-sensing transcriptional regulator